MAANDYRGYLRNHIEMENGQPRFHAAQNAAPTHRPLIFGTLIVMGLLQVASSVAILLHLTGYLREVDLSSAQQRPIEEIQREPIIDALRGDRTENERKRKCPKKNKAVAHLPIKAPTSTYANTPEKGITKIEWNADGLLEGIKYKDGAILVEEAGFYYVYAKTCFRYYNYETKPDPIDVSNIQLIQYVYRDRTTMSTSKPILLMKSGSTMRWNDTKYNMYCVQQGRGVQLSKGDGLFVSVSGAGLLDQEGEGSYFGAFKMSN